MFKRDMNIFSLLHHRFVCYHVLFFLFFSRVGLSTRPDRCRRAVFIIIMTISVSQRLDNPPQLTWTPLRVDQVAGTELGFQHLIRLCPLTWAQRGPQPLTAASLCYSLNFKKTFGKGDIPPPFKSLPLFQCPWKKNSSDHFTRTFYFLFPLPFFSFFAAPS